MKKFTILIIVCFFTLLFYSNSFAATKTAVTSGQWSTASIWSPSGVPRSTDDVIINSGVTVTFGDKKNDQGSINDVTVYGTLVTADIVGVELTIYGAFIVKSGSVVNIGGLYGGRIKVYGTGKSHVIWGTINIYWSIWFDYNQSSTSTVNLKSGGIIINDYAAAGQLYIRQGVVTTVESGAELINNCTDTNYSRCGIFLDTSKSASTLIIDGKFTNGPNGSIRNNGSFIINGTFYYPSGFWKNLSGSGYIPSIPVVYGSTGKLIYCGGSLTTSKFEWPNTYSPQRVTVSSSGTITLDTNKIITDSLKMLSGNINTSAYTLSLGSSSSNLGVLDYSSGTIITGATGGFKRWFATSTVNDILFPVGTASTINSINLSFTGAPSAGSLTAKFITGDPGAVLGFLYDAGINPEPNPYLIDCYSQRGYWQLDTGDGLSGGIYNISLRGEGFNPTGSEITNFTELRVLKRVNGSTNPWTVPPTHVPATGTNSIPVIQRAGLTSFSQFGMGGNWGRGNPLQGPLPVKLASFSSIISGRDVKLNWVTESEENNEGFEVQKSEYRIQESEIWNKIGFVKGNGTKNSATNYSFEDKNLQSGKYKYRLKQIDYNGNYEYFELAGVIEVGVPKKFDLSQNYPNPFNPVTKINFDIPESGLVTLKVYDILGKEVASLVNETREAGYYTITFDASKLSSGVYFYRLSLNGFNSVKRMAVIK